MLFLEVIRKKDGACLTAYDIDRNNMRFLVYADGRWKYMDMQEVRPLEPHEFMEGLIDNGYDKCDIFKKAEAVEEVKGGIWVGDDPGGIAKFDDEEKGGPEKLTDVLYDTDFGDCGDILK